MKHLFLFCVALITVHVSAQPAQKIGHADWEYIFSQLPEYKKIENELRVFDTQLQNQLKAKNQELESKYKIYMALPPNTPDAVKRDKESELNYLQEGIQKFQQDAQLAMQNKQTELITPVFSKVRKAIEEIALENDYSYIINPQLVGGNEVLLFAHEKFNIADLVLKKLGVTAVPLPSSGKN